VRPAHVQVETILAGGYPSEHKAQIQGSMWITGIREWDFVSYSPTCRSTFARLYVFTVKRDEAYIKELEAEVRASSPSEPSELLQEPGAQGA
jgi:hypothetical protein